MKRQQKRKHVESEDSEETDEKGEEPSKSPEDAPQPRSNGGAWTQHPGVREMSSGSEYFSCVSSPSKLAKLSCGIHGVQGDGPKDKPSIVQVKEQEEKPPASKLVSFSSCSSCKTCINSVCINKEETTMKIYYTEVKMKKGVAVSRETEETSESPAKQPRMEEVGLPEGLQVGTPPSAMSTRNLLSDSELNRKENKQETKAKPDDQPGSPAVEEIPGTEMPRVKTPDWLGSVESGFRCLACCRVFATIDVLQEHVQYGIREGFSCHVFHRTMTQLRGSAEAESAPAKAQEEAQEAEQKQEQAKKECEEEQPTGKDLAWRKPWSRCPGYLFHSPEGGSELGIDLLRELLFS
ncbi:PREDICTED: protein FAM170A isoform X3 [Chinchilla lanigera]|uniref:protein FAM170A isoform X3 n=1 Tax=Chinchilla lanigera TaxID=34839 RepID=UPI00038ED900|nr:PREDICTED: protein FAM170A isoform X3 [Chinchilla lanigera]